jgi:hypothetical protein
MMPSMSRGQLLASVVLSAIVVGIGLKVVRYGVVYSAPGDTLQRADAVMLTHGWRREANVPFGAGMPLVAATYVKTGCDGRATITLLGKHPELQHYVRLRHGGNVAFLHEAEGKAVPGAFDRQLEQARQWIGAPVGQPMMAVAPVPNGQACSPPPATTWAGVGQ